MRERCVILLACTLFGVACTDSAPKDPASIASSIARVEAELASLRKDTVTVFDYSTEGATIEAHYAGEQLRRLRAVYLGETGRASDTFYFDSALIFVERATVRYDEPLSGRTADSTTTRWFLGHDTIWTGDASVVAVREAARVLGDSLRESVTELRARLPRSCRDTGSQPASRCYVRQSPDVSHE